MPRGRRYTAKELMENNASAEIGSQNPEEFWGNKLKESQTPSEEYGGRSLYEHIQEHGQKEPISLFISGLSSTVDRPDIIEGHHRLAAMHHMNPDQFVKYRFKSWYNELY